MNSISPPLIFDNYQGFATASLVAQMVKNPPAMWETWVPSHRLTLHFEIKELYIRAN